MLRLRGTIPRDIKWDIVVDLFFYREPEEAEKEEQAAKELIPVKPEVVPHEPVVDLDWNATEPQTWEAEPVVPVAPVTAAAAPFSNTDDWSQQVQDELAATAAAAAAQPAQANWGGTGDWYWGGFDDFVFYLENTWIKIKLKSFFFLNLINKTFF